MAQQLQIEPMALEPSRHREEFIETATALGGRVCRDAIWADGRCNWIGPAMELLGGVVGEEAGEVAAFPAGGV